MNDYHRAIVAESHRRHDELHRILKKKLLKKPPCCIGCSACCYEPAFTERREAEYLLEIVPPTELAGVVERTRQWAGVMRGPGAVLMKSKEPNAFAYRLLRAPCPLLKDGKCLVYPRRPIGCRSHTATGPRTHCENDAYRPNQRFMMNKEPSNYAIQYLVEHSAMLRFDHLGAQLTELLLGETVPTAAKLDTILLKD